MIQAARTCQDFPVEGYHVTVVDDTTGYSLMKQIAPFTTSNNASYIEVARYSSSDGIQPNTKYTCSVLAYNAVGNSLPSSIVVCKETIWHLT